MNCEIGYLSGIVLLLRECDSHCKVSNHLGVSWRPCEEEGNRGLRTGGWYQVEACA